MDKFIILCTIALIFHCELTNAEVSDTKNSVIDEKCTSICYSTDCVNVAKSLLENMDQSIDPCDDFYRFACGNYIKKNVIPENAGFVSQFGDMEEKLNAKLFNAVNNEVLPSDLDAIKKLKVHFKSCLDEDEIEKVGERSLLNLMGRVGGWPVLLGDEWKEEDYKWEDVMSKISKEGSQLGFPIDLFVDRDSINSQKFSLNMVPARTHYYSSNGDKAAERFQSFLVETAVLLGANREKANLEMKDLVEFDRKLFEAELLENRPYELFRPRTRKTISDLNKEYPDLPWLDIINRILSVSNVTVTEAEIVEIYDPKFLSKVGSLIKNTPKRVLANYQVYQLIDNYILYLPKKFRNNQFVPRITFGGMKKLPERENFCLGTVRSRYDIALSALYLKNDFDQEAKNKVNELTQNIREQSKLSLKNVTWMNDHTREEALIKLQSMKTLAAYPDGFIGDKKIETYYENLEIIEGKFFDNVLKIHSHNKFFSFNRLHKPAQQFEWMSGGWAAFSIGSYSPKMNEISIFAGIVQEPFFKSQWPDYLNYGGMGYLVGQKITHVFDNIGRKYDYDGNTKDWWDYETTKDFEEKAQCKIDQYSNYTIKQLNQKINGTFTRDENIADENGIKLAYHAYEKLIKTRGSEEECLPDLKYTPKQLFWISAATTLCQKVVDGYLNFTINRFSRSPADARTNVVFADSEEFANDFKCTVGSTMNPVEKCQVW